MFAPSLKAIAEISIHISLSRNYLCDSLTMGSRLLKECKTKLNSWLTSAPSVSCDQSHNASNLLLHHHYPDPCYKNPDLRYHYPVPHHHYPVSHSREQLLHTVKR